MSMIERIGAFTLGLEKTSTPFESWAGSPIKTWSVTMRMLNIGELADISRLTFNMGAVEAAYYNKIYILAKSIVNIQGQPVATQEDVDAYNKEHNLSGIQQVDLFGYKVLFIRKWSEVLVNRFAYEYDQLQDEYLSQHLGRVLPDELRAAVSGVDFSAVTPPSQTTEGSDGTTIQRTAEGPTSSS